jgi:uncharacterized membrane protein
MAQTTAKKRMSKVAKRKKHSRWYFVGLGVMSLFYVGSGTVHLLAPEKYMPAMPPYIPSPLMVIFVSGMAEIFGGIGLLIPRRVFPWVRPAAAWGLVALLIAVSPVHINMCLNPEHFSRIPAWALWLRLLLQLPLIAWAWIYTRD